MCVFRCVRRRVVEHDSTKKESGYTMQRHNANQDHSFASGFSKECINDALCVTKD